MIKQCIYCDQPLDGSDEHILQKGLGSSLKSDKIICGECNQRFSRTIDEDLCTFYSVICNQLGVKGYSSSKVSGGFGKQIILNSPNGNKVKIDGTQRIGTQDKPIVSMEKDENGKISSGKITGTSYDAIKKTLKNIEKGMPNGTNLHVVSRKIDLHNSEIYSMSVDVSLSHIKGVKKSLINFIAYQDPSELDRVSLVTASKDVYDSSVVLDRTLGVVDVSRLRPEVIQPFFSVESLPEQVSQFITNEVTHSLIVSFNGDDQSIIGVAVLFGFFFYGFLLGDSYSGKSKSICYIRNPLPEDEKPTKLFQLDEPLYSKRSLGNITLTDELSLKIQKASKLIEPFCQEQSTKIAIYCKSKDIFAPLPIPNGTLEINRADSIDAVLRLLKLCIKTISDNSPNNDEKFGAEIEAMLQEASNYLVDSIIKQRPKMELTPISVESIGAYAIKFFFQIMAPNLLKLFEVAESR